jgi:hypothetical protein
MPDDRFDGTDSGPDGWDTPYAPRTTEPTGSELPSGDVKPADGERRAQREAATRPSHVADPNSYGTDGPDDPAGTPQR